MTVTEDEDGEHEEAENKTAFDKFIDIICVPWSSASGQFPTLESRVNMGVFCHHFACVSVDNVLSYILCDMVARLGCMWHVPAPIMGLTLAAEIGQTP